MNPIKNPNPIDIHPQRWPGNGTTTGGGGTTTGGGGTTTGGGGTTTGGDGGTSTTGGGQPPIIICENPNRPCPPGKHVHKHIDIDVNVRRPVGVPVYVTGAATGAGYVESGVPVAAESCAPCLWLKSKYDLTANVEWLNRYNLCREWLLSAN